MLQQLLAGLPRLRGRIAFRVVVCLLVLCTSSTRTFAQPVEPPPDPAPAPAAPAPAPAPAPTPAPAPDPKTPPKTAGEPAIAPRLPPAEVEKARGMTIVKIDVVGNERVTKDDILTYLRERVG